MRKPALLVLTFAIHVQLFAQEQFSVPYEKRRVDTEFSVDKLYNKKTGEQVSQQEFAQLIKQNPNLALEQVYDSEGNTVKYFYDPDKPISSAATERGNAITVGSSYPELTLKTVDGKKINLKDLKGKMVILRFEMEADSFRFKKHEIEEMDRVINATQRKSEIEAIIVFDATEQQIKQGFDLENSNFKLIPNGHNFHRKLNVNSFPHTVILDKQGRLMGEFSFSEEIDISAWLDKS